MENKNILLDSLLSNTAGTDKENSVVWAPFLMPEIFSGHLQQVRQDSSNKTVHHTEGVQELCKKISVTLWVVAPLSTPWVRSVFCCFFKILIAVILMQFKKMLVICTVRLNYCKLSLKSFKIDWPCQLLGLEHPSISDAWKHLRC